MLATGHTLSGLLAGAITAPVFELTPDRPGYWLYVGTTMGTALLPDIDMQGTTADRLWGPFTSGVRVRLGRKRRTIIPGLWSLVRPLVGGHRRGTHSVLGLLILLVAVWAAHFWVPSSVLVVMLGTGLGLRAVALVFTHLFDFNYRRNHWRVNLALSAVAAWAFVHYGQDYPSWLPWAMAGGALAHVLGDMCTDGRVRISWPTSDREFGLPKWLAFRAGGWWEHAVVLPLLVISSGLVMAYQFGYAPLEFVRSMMEKI